MKVGVRIYPIITSEVTTQETLHISAIPGKYIHFRSTFFISGRPISLGSTEVDCGNGRPFELDPKPRRSGGRRQTDGRHVG